MTKKEFQNFVENVNKNLASKNLYIKDVSYTIKDKGENVLQYALYSTINNAVWFVDTLQFKTLPNAERMASIIEFRQWYVYNWDEEGEK